MVGHANAGTGDTCVKQSPFHGGQRAEPGKSFWGERAPENSVNLLSGSEQPFRKEKGFSNPHLIYPVK